ncbi:MAG: cytochrome c biogenesis protein ResB [bacterium]
MKRSGPEGFTRTVNIVWSTLTSPVTFVVISFLWSLNLGLGSIAAYFDDRMFHMKMDSVPFNVWLREVAPESLPQSLWIYILVVLTYLMVASLLLCTVNWFFRKRRRFKGIGEVLVHLGFLLIFAGFVLGSAFGQRTLVEVIEGGTSKVPMMDLTLSLQRLEVIRSPDGGSLDTLSEISLTGGDGVSDVGRIRLNHPLISGNTVVYPPDDYGYFIIGGVVGTSEAGVRYMERGSAVELAGGRKLILENIVQPGQTMGKITGPGLFLVIRDTEGTVVDTGYISSAPGNKSPISLGGTTVTLGQLREAAIGRYRVNYDPGVWLVITGAVLLALGTLWALAGYLGIIPQASRVRD